MSGTLSASITTAGNTQVAEGPFTVKGELKDGKMIGKIDFGSGIPVQFGEE